EFESDALSAPFVSASIGIAVYPNDAKDQQELFSHADTALYRAKADGRRTYRFFEAEMGIEVQNRRTLEQDLRTAILRDELYLVYQPELMTGTRDVIGFEVLLRWKHPTRGNVSPAEFIPIAEEMGIILQIGEWVLRSACIEAVKWTNQLKI